jgi:hypothetical protein
MVKNAGGTGTVRGRVTPTEGTSIVRIRSTLALLVTGLLLQAGVASAQSTTTEPLSDYTTTTPTVTTPKPAPEPSANNDQNDVAPSVASQPAASAPSKLAFTGAEPLLLIALGVGAAGGATVLLLRDRRRTGGR